MVGWSETGGVHVLYFVHTGQAKGRSVFVFLLPALFLVLVLRSESGGVSRERERCALSGGDNHGLGVTGESLKAKVPVNQRRTQSVSGSSHGLSSASVSHLDWVWVWVREWVPPLLTDTAARPPSTVVAAQNGVACYHRIAAFGWDGHAVTRWTIEMRYVLRSMSLLLVSVPLAFSDTSGVFGEVGYQGLLVSWN